MRQVNEIQAAVEGVKAMGMEVGSIIEIGGQKAKYITGFQS